jgi:hypothetical protein
MTALRAGRRAGRKIGPTLTGEGTMARMHDQTVAEMAQRIRQAQAPCAEMLALLDHGGSEELCRLDLIDAIEAATNYEIAACQAGRIADAVLKLMRRQTYAAPAPSFT